MRTRSSSPDCSSRSWAYSRIVSSIPKRPSLRVSEALVGERGDAVERLEAADGLGGVEREAAGEDAELGEQPLRRRVEQVVAPVDRAAQRLLAARDVARAGAEEVEPAREAVEDRGGGEDLAAGGGELDRQRQAVEARADLLDQPLVVLAEREPRVDGAGAALEQRDRGLGGERAERQLVLGREPQRGAARDHDLRARRGGQQAADLARRVEQLLEVVDDDEQFALLDLAERLLELGADLLRVGEGRERDEARTVGELRGEPVRELERRSATCRSRPVR